MAVSVSLTRGVRPASQVDCPRLAHAALEWLGSETWGFTSLAFPCDLGTFRLLVARVKLVSRTQISESQVIVSCLRDAGLSTF